MAVISFSKRFLFLKTRKTGGTSVQESLLPKLSGHDIVTREWHDVRTGAATPVEEFAQLEQIHAAYPETRDGFFTFGFTRNPYAITLSRYGYQIRMGRIPGPATREAFNRWAREVYFVGEPGFPGGRYLLDRSRHILFDEGFRPKVDYIGRLERFAKDFDYCTGRVGLSEARLANVNSSLQGKADYRDWMDGFTRRLVEVGFDFELDYFGYGFDDQSGD